MTDRDDCRTAAKVRSSIVSGLLLLLLLSSVDYTDDRVRKQSYRCEQTNVDAHGHSFENYCSGTFRKTTQTCPC